MKITIYELLGMIKDGKAPNKIKYENREYYLYDNKSYLTTNKTRYFDRIYFSDLNIEVEILEEKKIPEKLETYKEIDDEDSYANILKVSKNGEYEIDEATSVIVDKINSIIDYLKSKGE